MKWADVVITTVLMLAAGVFGQALWVFCTTGMPAMLVWMINLLALWILVFFAWVEASSRIAAQQRVQSWEH